MHRHHRQLVLAGTCCASLVAACVHDRGVVPLPAQGIQQCSLVVRDERRNREVVWPVLDADSGYWAMAGVEKKTAAHWEPLLFKIEGDKVEVRGVRRNHIGSIERSADRVILRQVGSQILDASDQKIVYNGICPGRVGDTAALDRCIDFEFFRAGQGLAYRTRGLVNEKFIDLVQCGNQLAEVPPELLVVLDLYLLRAPEAASIGRF